METRGQRREGGGEYYSHSARWRKGPQAKDSWQQDAVQVIQQWPLHTGKAKIQVFAQSTRVDVSLSQCGILERHCLQSVLESQRNQS